VSNEKQTWEMSYDEIWKQWNDKYAFGSKGEMSLAEAKEVHAKWKSLGTEARLGI
jgi:hypothetical protein